MKKTVIPIPENNCPLLRPFAVLSILSSGPRRRQLISGNGIILFCTLIFCNSAFGFGGGLRESNRRLSDSGSPASNGAYEKLMRELDSIGGSVDCSSSLSSAAQCLICNCANEAAINEPIEEFAKISRVVFSRIKYNRKNPSSFSNKVCGVICEPSQFSWTIGYYNSQCQRQARSIRGRYMSNYTVTGDRFIRCRESVKVAAKKELVDNPNGIFALNYLNPIIASPDWESLCKRTPAVTQVGAHLFCSLKVAQNTPVPSISSEAIAYIEVPYRYEN